MSASNHTLYRFGPFTLDVPRRTLVRGTNPVGLEPKAFDVLSLLVMRHGNVVDKEELMRRVWPDCFVQESSITQNIHVLRKALGDDPGNGGHHYIVTVSGTGYKFVAEVTGAVTEGVREANDGGGKIAGGNGGAVARGSAAIFAPGSERQQEFGVQASACSFPIPTSGDGDGRAAGEEATGRPLGHVAGTRGGRKNHNLPVQPAALIGREADVAAVKELIRQQHRLVTLAGPGGSGKTTLAITVAGELLEEFADGVCLVELAHLSDPSLMIPTIAQALGVREDGSMPIADCLKLYLEGKRLLLVLDNFEHLLAGELSIVDLLASSSELRIMATSRIVLKVRYEQEYHVEPLALPAAPGRRIDLEELSKCASVALFVERARAVRPEFGLTGENAGSVCRICTRVDGLPLAIELAAPWVRVLPPEALLERLNTRFDLLSDGARDLPARQRTLRATIEWSYGLLTDDEKTLFRRLAVFVGGFTLEAAEAVCCGVDGAELDVLSLLSSLMDKNMVQRCPAKSGVKHLRYMTLETIREFGLELLGGNGEEASIRMRYVQFYDQLATEIEPTLIGPKLLAALDLIDLELGNFRAATEWAMETLEISAALRIGASISEFWKMRGSLAEGRRWLDRLAALQTSDSSASAKTVRALAGFEVLQGEWARARAHCDDALHTYRELDDRNGQASVLKLLAWIEGRLLENGVAIPRLEEALLILEGQCDNWGIACLLNDLGAALYAAGNAERARPILDDSLAMYRRLQDQSGMAFVLNNTALISMSIGDVKGASSVLAECLVSATALGDPHLFASCLETTAELFCMLNDAERAACLLGAANSVREYSGVPVPPYSRPAPAETMVTLKSMISEQDLNRAWERGRLINPQEVLAYALPGLS